jgi:hypothetical protein
MQVFDTPEKIRAFSLASLKGRLYLESKGMKSRGVSALKVAKQLGYKGNRQEIIEKIGKDVADILAKGT